MAHCLSVETEPPSSSDAFLIDTNVLLYVAYAEFQGQRARALRMAYSAFLQTCRRVGAALYVCGLSYPEIVNAVERFRWKEFGGESAADQKAFRRIESQRRTVLADARQVWSVVRGLASVLSLTVDEPAVERIQTLFSRSCIDGYDGFIIDAARGSKIPNIVTHDGDFATASNLIVFTANRSLLN